MKLKVCHMTSVHSRYDVRIFLKECRSLSNSGYDVTLLCADNLPGEVVNGVKIVSINFSPKNRLDRIINSKKLMVEAALEVDADIYHFHDPELIPVGLKLKKHNKKIIYDSHEDYSLNIKFKQWIPKLIRPLMGEVFNSYEKKSLMKFDAAISVTPQIVNKFRKVNENSVLITNFPIVDNYMQPCEEAETPISKRGKKICFAGSIEPGRMHHTIIKAMEKVQDVEYLLAGSGSSEYIEELRNLPMWKNVRYYKQLTFKEV